MNIAMAMACGFVAVGLDSRFVGDMGNDGVIVGVRIVYALLGLAFLAYGLSPRGRTRL